MYVSRVQFPCTERTQKRASLFAKFIDQSLNFLPPYYHLPNQYENSYPTDVLHTSHRKLLYSSPLAGCTFEVGGFCHGKSSAKSAAPSTSSTWVLGNIRHVYVEVAFVVFNGRCINHCYLSTLSNTVVAVSYSDFSSSSSSSSNHSRWLKSQLHLHLHPHPPNQQRQQPLQHLPNLLILEVRQHPNCLRNLQLKMWLFMFGTNT